MKSKYQNTKILLIFIALTSVTFSYNFSALSLQFPSVIAQAQNNNKAEAERLREEGEKQLEAGQFVQGTENLERAMRIYQQIGDIENYREILNRVSLIYYTRGAYGAYDQLESLIPEVRKLNAEEKTSESDSQTTEQISNLLEIEQFAAFIALGKSYLYEGNYTNALTNFELAESLSATRYQAIEQQAASDDAHKMGDNFREMISRRIPVLLLLGETYLQQNNASKAITYFEEASEIETKINNEYKQFLTPYVFINYFEDPNLYLSRANYSLGNYQRALTYARKAIEKGESIQNPYSNHVFGVRTGDLGNGHGYVLAGIALEKLGQLEQAEKELEKAVQTFESIRKKSTFQGDIKDILKLFNNQVRATALLQRVLVAQNKPEAALAVAEWGRGRLLVEASTAPRELTLEEKVDALVDAKYASIDICQSIGSLFPEANIPEGYEHLFPSNQIQTSCDSEALIQAEKESTLQAARKDPIILDLYTGATPNNISPSNIKPPNIEQLKQIAQSHQATLVEYSIISETTFFHSSRQHSGSRNIFPGEEQTLLIWVIKPTGEIQFRQIDLKTQDIAMKDLVNNTRQRMGLGRRAGISIIEQSTEPIDGFSGVQAKEQLKQLHQLLIAPIANLLPTDPEAKVVFIPDKEIFLVPFAALTDSADKYLIEKHTIITAPSIQALGVIHQKEQQTVKSQRALVVGNPTMPFIPQPNNQPPIQLNNLDGAEKEAREVAQLLNAQFLTGSQATKANVLQKLPNAKYIHLATHGLLDDYTGFGIPGTIALAPSDEDNGLLSASVIQELNLSAELAVLSACDTGRGDITGDGVVGLSRAFIIAGVPSLVVSLWAVPDAPTAELMVEFYRNFKERNLDKAQALRKAMLTLMQTNPDPVDWAAFTLIGEAE